MDHSIDVQLTIPTSSEDLQVAFTFDPTKDNADAVASELLQTLDLGGDITADGLMEIKRYVVGNIGSQVADALAAEDRSDGPAEDPEYWAILDRQARELRELAARQQGEQIALVARLTQPKKHGDDLLLFE
jgi:hypothetical protein